MSDEGSKYRSHANFISASVLRNVETEIVHTLKQVKDDAISSKNKLRYLAERICNKLLIILLAVVLLFNCTDDSKTFEIKNKPVLSGNTIPIINYSVVATYPHDTTSFTQGLLVYRAQLLESTGSPDNIPYTKSVFGIVDLKTGKIDPKAALDRKIYFGEGIVILKNKLYQITYKNQVGFIYNLPSYKKTGQFVYQNKEGWGLTTDGTNIIMSDGTNNLTYLDPSTLKVIKTLSVSENGFAADYLNELEYIKGYIYANIWRTNYIAKIDPITGKIVAKIDLVPLSYEARNKYNKAEVLNGIAFDSISNKIYVTGKLWPTIYQIEFPH